MIDNNDEEYLVDNEEEPDAMDIKDEPVKGAGSTRRDSAWNFVINCVHPIAHLKHFSASTRRESAQDEKHLGSIDEYVGKLQYKLEYDFNSQTLNVTVIN